MTVDLNNSIKIKQLDSKNMVGSIEKLADQIKQIQAEVKKVKIPASYNKIKNIVFLGMGGSALGAHVIRSVFEAELNIPLEIVNGYDIPNTINKNTLVFAMSYSGTTEEVLSALAKTQKRKSKIIIITSGGELGQIAKKEKLPALIFSTENNPCGSPRMGLGYTIFGPLLLLLRLKLIKSTGVKLEKIISVINRYQKVFGLNNANEDNIAKKFAKQILHGPVWYVASSHLAGSVHVAANQLNENAKRFGSYFLIPELNHHLLEGLSFPKENTETFIFIESNLYHKKVSVRYEVTKNVLAKHSKHFLAYHCTENSMLLQAVEILVLGSYVSFYTAMLENIDPTAIPTVDFLKAALKAKSI